MTRPRFLADEDLRFEIVLAVRRMEPAVEITTVVELDQSGSTDADVLAFAKADGWIVVSHDVNMLSGASTKSAYGSHLRGRRYRMETLRMHH